MVAIVAALAFATSPAAAQLLPADAAAAPQPPASTDPAPSAVPLPTPALPAQPQAAQPPQIVMPPPSAATEVTQPLPPVSEESDSASASTPATAPVQAKRTPAAAEAAPPPARETVTPRSQTSAAAEGKVSKSERAPEAPSTLLPPASQQGVALTPLATDSAAEPNGAPAAEARPSETEGLLWAIGGGVLLLGAGIGTFVATRRRVSTRHVARDAMPSVTPVAEPVTPIPAATPLAQTEASPRAVFAPAAAQSSVMPGEMSDRRRVLEAMVAAPPSPENPFLTRKARLARANYILSHGVPEPLQSETPVTSQPAAAMQPRPSSQQVHGFGKAWTPQRRGLTPAAS